MSEGEEFAELLERLERGEQDAYTEVFERFANRLIPLARSQLDARTRQKLDAEDVLQSAFRSFFSRQANGEFNLAGWGSMWGVLVVITLRKCGRRRSQWRAARRDVRREQHVEAEGGEPAMESDRWLTDQSEPTPAEAAMLADLLEHLMAQLDERERTVLELRLQGFNIAEICSRIQRSERTVHRILTDVRALCDDMESDAADPR